MTQVSARRIQTEANLVEGEFAFTQTDFDQIAGLLYRQAGITLPASKATLVYSRLAKRIRQLGLRSFADYREVLANGDNVEEGQTMLRALTTNVTRFFREPHHFDHLRDQILLPAADQVRQGKRLRLWSAACSTGQEPYSMALTLIQAIPEAARLDIKILATDIDSNVVETARAGIYSEELMDAVPASLRGRWFDKVPGQGWQVNATLRNMISFKELNLLGAWPMKGPFDVIFCRNVVIYFDEPTQDRVWRRFAQMMARGSYLYVGHSERVGYSDSPFINDGLTSYRMEGARA